MAPPLLPTKTSPFSTAMLTGESPLEENGLPFTGVRSAVCPDTENGYLAASGIGRQKILAVDLNCSLGAHDGSGARASRGEGRAATGDSDPSAYRLKAEMVLWAPCCCPRKRAPPRRDWMRRWPESQAAIPSTRRSGRR